MVSLVLGECVVSISEQIAVCASAVNTHCLSR